MAKTQAEIVEKASVLAADLTGGGVAVEKNVLLSLVADFMSDPRADVQKLRRTLRLLGEGSGGHLKRGGGTYADQVRTAIQELGKILDEGGLDPQETKSLFGWTARLLVARKGRPSPHLERGPSTTVDPRRAPAGKGTDPRRPESGKKQAPATRLGLGGKSLDVLAKLRQDLDAKDKEKKD